jgi:hypothetical protein
LPGDTTAVLGEVCRRIFAVAGLWTFDLTLTTAITILKRNSLRFLQAAIFTFDAFTIWRFIPACALAQLSVFLKFAAVVAAAPIGTLP